MINIASSSPLFSFCSRKWQYLLLLAPVYAENIQLRLVYLQEALYNLHSLFAIQTKIHLKNVILFAFI